MATKKTTAKHDYHVQQAFLHALSQELADAPLAPLPAENANFTLEQALAESGETIQDLVEAPVKVAAKRVDRSATIYMITDKAMASIQHVDTLQRGCTIAVGALWRSNEFKAPNTRVAAMAALEDAADEEGMIGHLAAMAALKPLKDQALLGSGTPNSYIREFVRIGYLEEV